MKLKDENQTLLLDMRVRLVRRWEYGEGNSQTFELELIYQNGQTVTLDYATKAEMDGDFIEIERKATTHFVCGPFGMPIDVQTNPAVINGPHEGGLYVLGEDGEYWPGSMRGNIMVFGRKTPAL